MTTQEFEYQIVNLQGTLEAFSRKFASDKDESRDLVQETILKALRNKDKYESNTNLKAWLYTIMKNTYINNYNKTIKRNFRIEGNESTELKQLLSTSTYNNPESNMVIRDVRKEINSLKPEFKIPFVMFLQGYKYREISDELNVALGTIKHRIFMARHILADKLSVYNN